jgi:hypothetical protein
MTLAFACPSQRTMRFAWTVGAAHRLLGHMAHRRGDLPEAQRRLGEALAAFAAIPAPFEMAATQLDLAHVDHARGEKTAARLGEARAGFAALGLADWVGRADALAARLDGPRAPTSS